MNVKFGKILKISVILILMLYCCKTTKTQALTITTSNHTYNSYSLYIEKGEEKLISAKDLIKYVNAHESGYTNTIETSAWFYKTGSQSGFQPAIKTTALTSGAAISVNEITDSNNLVQSIRINGKSVGCTRISGMFEWRDSITGKINTIHRYPFQFCVYVHMPVSGIKVISNGVSDNASGINYYTYVGSKDRFDINMLPFNSSYTSWDKVANNAIQNIITSTSDNKTVSFASVGNYVLSHSHFIINGIKEGEATIKVSSPYNVKAARSIKVNVLKKPTYSISEKELTLATNATTSDMIYSTVSNLGNLNKCNIKWMSSNTSLLEVKNDTTSKPTLITKGSGEVTLKCQFTDLVAKNNKSVNATTINIPVTIKDDKDIQNKIVTNNNTYIENGDTITSKNEGDIVYIRVEEFGIEAGYKCESSNNKVCTVSKTNRSGYSFQIEKKGEGTAQITLTTKSGKVFKFNYEATGENSQVKDSSDKKTKKSTAKPVKPAFKSIKVKKNKRDKKCIMYIVIKKNAKKYKAKGFQIKIKRNGKTIIKRKWYRKRLKLVNVRKGSKYTICIRTFKGKEYSKWAKKTKKVK